VDADAHGLRWLELDADEALGHPTVVADLLARSLDGVTVRGVLTPEQSAAAVADLERDPTGRCWAMFGSMLGRPLPEHRGPIDGPDGRMAYLDGAAAARGRYREAFGFDPFERVAATVERLSGGIPLQVPAEDGRSYNPGNIRWYEPGSCGLPAHVGNEFAMHDDPSMAHLRTVTSTRDFLSWLVVLQPPDVGGALRVYPLEHEAHEPADPVWDDRGRDDTDFDDRPSLAVAPGAGDLVVFVGGWRWHRVDRIGPGRARITYGGFIGVRHDGSALNSWF
jgi:hypothetical protein